MRATPSAKNIVQNQPAKKPVKGPVSNAGCKNRRTKITFKARRMSNGFAGGAEPIRATGVAKRKNSLKRYKIP